MLFITHHWRYQLKEHLEQLKADRVPIFVLLQSQEGRSNIIEEVEQHLTRKKVQVQQESQVPNQSKIMNNRS